MYYIPLRKMLSHEVNGVRVCIDYVRDIIEAYAHSSMYLQNCRLRICKNYDSFIMS
jgi:hypothetical protein